MLQFLRVAALLCFITGAVGVSAAPVILYDGTSVPTAQGWQRIGGEGVEAVLPGGLVQFTTTTNGATSQINLYQYATGASNFIASIRLKAVSVSPHNQFDAGLMFAIPENASFPQNSTNRNRMLAIDPAQVIWGDDTASFPVATGVFHEYAFRYQAGKLDVYVDATYADIAAGVALPILTKTSAPFPGPGTIVFGDQTNDPNVDSDYIVDFVKFQNLDLVDAPVSVPTLNSWTLWLLAVGVLLTATRYRRSASRPRVN